MDWRITSRRLSCVLLLSAAAFPAAAITPAPTAKTCDAVLQWARDNREQLPRDYQSLLAYPTAERRAIYTRMSAAEKAAFWSDRIGVYLEEHPHLGASQRVAIGEAKAFLQADVYERSQTRDLEARARLEQELGQLEDRMVLGLGEEAARELLYGLGPEAPGQSGVLGEGLCECSKTRDCPLGGHCVVPPHPCEVVPIGCGIGGMWPCELMCKILDPKG